MHSCIGLKSAVWIGMFPSNLINQPNRAVLSQTERNKAIEFFVKVCYKHAVEMAEAVSKEMGKPIKNLKLDIEGSKEHFQALMEIVEEALKPETVFEDETKKHVQFREPQGVLVCACLWSLPIFIDMFTIDLYDSPQNMSNKEDHDLPKCFYPEGFQTFTVKVHLFKESENDGTTRRSIRARF